MIDTFDPVDRFCRFQRNCANARINKLRRARRPSLSFAGTSARVAGRLVASFRGDGRVVEIPELSEGSGRRFPVGTCAPLRIACPEFPPNSPPRLFAAVTFNRRNLTSPPLPSRRRESRRSSASDRGAESRRDGCRYVSWTSRMWSCTPTGPWCIALLWKGRTTVPSGGRRPLGRRTRPRPLPGTLAA